MRIPIVMVTDINYISPTRVAIWTMRKNTSQDVILDITILCCEDLREDSKIRLYELEKTFLNLKICFYNISSEIFQEAKPQAHIPIASFYRLVIGEVLNEEKCLFLDGDLIINTDLKKLYLENLDNYYIAGVRDLEFFINPDRALSYFEKYDFKDCRNYVNAGVMLFNLTKLRQDHLQDKFLECMKTPYPYMDQDILNKVCGKKIKILDWKYNFFNRCSDQEFVLGEINQGKERWGILHFAGQYKPWNNLRIRGAKEWWKWAKEALEENEYSRMYKRAEMLTRESDWSYILECCTNQSNIIVVGYSYIGMGVFRALKKCKLNASIHICDNSKEKQKLSNESIMIYSLEELAEKYPDALWINTSQKRYTEIINQLNGLGVSQKQIIRYIYKNEAYFNILDDGYLNYELKDICFWRT